MLGKTIGDLEVGDIFAPVEYTLTAMMASEYSAATDEVGEWFQSAHNPERRQVRPPTLVHNDKMKLLEANCLMERRIAGVVAKDARIHYEYHAKNHSIGYVGERFVVTGKIVDLYEKRGRRFLVYEIEVRTSDGRLITTYTDTTLLRYKTDAETADA